MQTKKKVLIGGLSSLAVAAGVAMTGGTSAYYYDLERSDGNKLAACSLDLVEDQVQVTQTAFGDEVTDPLDSQAVVTTTSNDTPDNPGALSTIMIENMLPGDAFRVDITLRNAGSCAGEMWGDVNFPIDDNENGRLEPEMAPGVPDPDTDGGDLDDLIQAVYLGPSDDGVSFGPASYNTLAYAVPWLLDSDFEAGEINVVSVQLRVPDDGTAQDGNEIMSDYFTFALDFAAAQKNKINPRPGASGRDLNDLSTLNNS